MDTKLWDHLIQNLPWCRNTRELELTDSKVSQPYCVPSFKRGREWVGTLIGEPIMTPDLRKVLQHMSNVRRLRLSWTTGLDLLREVLDALVDSRHGLEEFDLSVQVSNNRRVLSGFSPTAYMEKLRGLQIWSNPNLTELRKLSIHFGRGHRKPCLPLGEMSYITTMLSKTQALTHLNLTIDHTSALKSLLDQTWPNLENLVIGSNQTDLLPKDCSQAPSILINFFKRHRKLTTLSLPSSIYHPHSQPYITMDSLPALVSFSYNPPVQVSLSNVLSTASARRLLHLTISEKNASLMHSNMDIYKELISLRTCCITSEPPSPTNYENINRIIENFVAHVTNLEKIHIPPIHGNVFEGIHFETLSLLQCLPRLTHLSGLTYRNGTHREISTELYQFYQLKYLISPLFSVGGRKPFCVFGLTRDKTKRCVLFEVVSDNSNPEYDMGTWGNLYKGMDA
ncbi:hypothetical protein Clacol_001114 [Clathrus columnatus]|uniref:F-box domain-containing protein n=1 Tax=Clathrus columnatus TaxID=1419009 RepID=A0AAV5A095_9AGAM|nr:hypothetical protein Clacol_001114 [Clathrus columnatus]